MSWGAGGFLDPLAVTGAGGGFGGPGGLTQQQEHVPAWSTSVFTADMCESMVAGVPIEHYDYSKHLVSSMESLLQREMDDRLRTGVIACIHAWQRAESIWSLMQMNTMYRAPFHLARAIDKISRQLQASTIGDWHVLPCFQSVMAVKHDRAGFFTATFINIDPNFTEYLLTSAERPPKLLIQSVLEIKDVPKARMTSEAFWATVLKADEANDEVRMTHLLTWLNQKTIGENIRATTNPTFVSGTKSMRGNLWKSFVHAIKYILRQHGVAKSGIQRVRLALKGQLLSSVDEELKQVKATQHSTKLVIQGAIQNAARALARNSKHLPQIEFKSMRETIDSIIATLATVECSDKGETAPPPELNLKDGWDKLQQPHLFPLMDTLRRIEDTEMFVGTAVEQPRVMPVNLIQFPSKATSLAEILEVLDRAVRSCTRIQTQLTAVKQGAFLIVSLLTDVFVRVLPCPVGPQGRGITRDSASTVVLNDKKDKKDDAPDGEEASADNKKKTAHSVLDSGEKKKAAPKSCAWTNKDIVYGQQLQGMRMIWHCMELFIWASFSIASAPEFDSQRLIVMASMNAMADALLRNTAADQPSIISKHLSGANGKHGMFAATLGPLALQTEQSVTLMPEVTERRCAVIDYFEDLSAFVPPQHGMWQWENGLTFCRATQQFLGAVIRGERMAVQPSLQYFTKMERENDKDFSGVVNMLGHYWPEFRYMRDITLLYKWMMAPRSKLPPVNSDHIDNVLDSPQMEVNVYRRMFESEYMNRSIYPKVQMLRYPSQAIASRHTAPYDGETEDDILHVKNLPTFGDVMGQRDSELLLSYLTVPYIRLPLVLEFFATEDRVGCLGNKHVKEIFEGVLFEPGRFLSAVHEGIAPKEVPTEQTELLATQFGLLANELQLSPSAVMQPLTRLVGLARELDAGTVFNDSVVEIILYLLRICSRALNYATHVLSLFDQDDHVHGGPDGAAGRGIVMRPADAEELRTETSRMWALVEDELIPMLDGWLTELTAQTTLDDDEVVLAGKLHMHTILLLQCAPAGPFPIALATHAVASAVFLNTRVTFDDQASDNYTPEIELFNALQKIRPRLAKLLYTCPPQCANDVLNEAVRVSTGTSKKSSASTAFGWAFVAGEGCVGRYSRIDNATGTSQQELSDAHVPDLQVGLNTAFGTGVVKVAGSPCVDDGKQDVEINLSTWGLTFNAAHLIALPGEIAYDDNVQEVFNKESGDYVDMSSVQCAVLQDAENRIWVRMVGQQHDVQMWKNRDPRIPLPSPTYTRVFPDDLSATEAWIFPLVEPIRKRYFQRSAWEPPIFLLLPETKLTEDQHVMLIQAACSKTGKKLKEIVAFRDHHTVHVYDVFSFARRMYRSLIFSSDAHFSLEQVVPSTQDRMQLWAPWERHAGGEVDADNDQGQSEDCVILRHATHPKNFARGIEMFIPPILLRGLIPSCLFDDYFFWQDADDNIRGYPLEIDDDDDDEDEEKKKKKLDRAKLPILWFHWRDTDFEQTGDQQTAFRIIRFARRREAPRASEKAVLHAQKFQPTDDTEEELGRLRTNSTTGESLEEEETDEGPGMGMYREASIIPDPAQAKAAAASLEDCNMLMLNLQYARKGTPLHSLAHVLTRIETLSHVLCWTTQIDYEEDSKEALTVDLIQLPRLKLQFGAKVDADGNVRLYSLDHAHLFISNARESMLVKLLQGLPHSLVLSDAHGGLAVLVPAFEVVRPKIGSAPFSTELVVHRRNSAWLESLDTKYYLYPVHVSMSFLLSPTLASALYLLAMRFLHCEYAEVFALAATIATDVQFTTEEAQNYQLLKSQDSRPEACACRCKIGLLMADCPVKAQWLLASEAARMISCLPLLPINCLLTPEEETRLLKIIDQQRKKVRIIEELTRKWTDTEWEHVDNCVEYSMKMTSGDSYHSMSSSEFRAFKQTIKKITTRLAEECDVAVDNEELLRLFFIHVQLCDRETMVKGRVECLLVNRGVVLNAERDAASTNASKIDVTLKVPEIPEDGYWRSFSDYDVVNLIMPDQHPYITNDEDKALTLSDSREYLYCGTKVRSNGTCKCRSCDGNCGPDDGCPCGPCERANKKNKHRLLPSEISESSVKVMSFFNVNPMISDVFKNWSVAMANRKGSAEAERLPQDLWKCKGKLTTECALRSDDDAEHMTFLQMYEAMTGTMKVRIGSTDCAADLAELLFPMYREARDPVSGLGSIMHYLINNPAARSKVGRYRHGKESFAKRMETIYASIIQQGAAMCTMPAPPPADEEYPTTQSFTVRPRLGARTGPMQPLLETSVLPTQPPTDCEQLEWGPVDVSVLRVARGERVDLDDNTRNELCGVLLASIVPGGIAKKSDDANAASNTGDELVVFGTPAEVGIAHVDPTLPFDLKKHQASKTSVAAAMVKRLEVDMKDYADQHNATAVAHIAGLASETQLRETLASPEKTKVLLSKLTTLQESLTKIREADTKYFLTAFAVCERTANATPDSGSSTEEAVVALRRIAGQEATLDLMYLISCLCCLAGMREWRELNPFLTDTAASSVVALLITALLRANRVGHASRAAEASKELHSLLHKADEYRSCGDTTLLGAAIASVQQKADTLAGLLAGKRVYMDIVDAKENGGSSRPLGTGSSIFAGKKIIFDPRFLLFEYNWNLVLRRRQRELITEMRDSVGVDQSIVKQMIMGAGKTTVVGPLLAMMLANGSQLVIQVVPPALLDFTRSVLRSTFSCVLQKQIFCFSCDRASEIDSELVEKFEHARKSRGIVVTTPSAIKSVFLKLIEAMDRQEDAARQPPPGMIREMGHLHAVVKQWKQAVLVMDEVDMLLHPLKSELNFPIGAKHDIDFAPLRWKLPMHLLDAVFYSKIKRVSVGVKETPEMHALLSEIDSALLKGLAENTLQGTPHTVLLSMDFYEDALRPHFAKWLLLFLKAHHFAGLSDEDTMKYIQFRPSEKNDAELNKRVTALEPDHVKTLNLAYEWLSAFLPHVLQKIDRVSFGIMNSGDMSRARRDHPGMPRSRFVTAIPFVGKDLPSQSSEFAHPDVVIGLTILAYRYEGLRKMDFTQIMQLLHRAVEKEVGRYHLRRTNILYNKWVQCAGGKMLQNFQYGDKNQMPHEEEIGMQPTESLVWQTAAGDDLLGDGKEKGAIGVLPLKLMKQANDKEEDKLYMLWHRTPEVIHWYLHEVVFPEYMRHQQLKLSASGQELGGDMLFPKRVGFSGTPSDLLPVELGTCEYERGTDGQLVHTLTSPHVMSATLIEPGWTVRSVLDRMANANPPFHALIDTGALITGMTNLQVAQYLLKKGLPQMEGVVFLDELDRKMILVKATGRVLKLAECGIPKIKRFAFYDQVHTTGMDIQHWPNACAVQTLGKDMVFRDFAQGAYRMRGISQGQTVNVFVIPEVFELIRTSVRCMKDHDSPTHVTRRGSLDGQTHNKDVLQDITAWLLLNSIKSEHTQHNQLCLQTIGNVWRKEAFRRLATAHDRGEFATRTSIKKGAVDALGVYREPVDYAVPIVVPQPRMFSEAVQSRIDDHASFIPTGVGKNTTDRIASQTKAEDEIDNPVIDVQMVQEQEEEREAEQEKEREQEIELEKFVDATYSRDDEAPVPWALASLRDSQRAVQFYSLKQFQLHEQRPLEFPDNIVLSRNFFNPAWGGMRRIKNAAVAMEWIPTFSAVKERSKPRADYGTVDRTRAAAALSASIGLLRGAAPDLSPEQARDLVCVALAHVGSREDIPWPAFFVNGRAASTDRDVALRSAVEQVLEILASNFLRDEDDGRLTALVTLSEAQTVRRAIHVQRQAGAKFIDGADTHLQLRMLAANNAVLDATPQFPQAKRNYLAERNYQCLRFFDGELQYTDRDVGLLLRAVHPTLQRQRQAFFLQVIGCRRRAQQRWERSPVALAFDMADPYQLLHQNTVGLCMRRELDRLGLHVADAFVAFNSSHTGALSPDEVWGALKFCSLDVTASDVLDLIQVADSQHEGTLQYADFLTMLTGNNDVDDDDTGGAGGGASNLPDVPPYGADELKALRQSREAERRRLEAEANEAAVMPAAQLHAALEAEQLRSELERLQVCENPRLADSNVQFNMTVANGAVELVQGYGPIAAGAATGDEPEAKFTEFRTRSGIEVNVRCTQLLMPEPTPDEPSDDKKDKKDDKEDGDDDDAEEKGDGDKKKKKKKGDDEEDEENEEDEDDEENEEDDEVEDLVKMTKPTGRSVLDKYMLSYDFRIPRPELRSGRTARQRAFEILEDDGEQLPLLVFKSLRWRFDPKKRKKANQAGRDDDNDEEEEDEDEEDYYEEDDDDDSCDSDDDDSSNASNAMEKLKKTLLRFCYDTPDGAVKHRIRRLTQYTHILEDVSVPRVNTTMDGNTLVWMKIACPAAGWVVLEENSQVHWNQENIILTVEAGTLTFNNTWGAHHNLDSLPKTEINHERQAKNAIGGDLDAGFEVINWWIDSDDDDDDEEEDEDDFAGGGGGDADLTQLVEALRKAKLLEAGDKVTRNPDEWDHGDEDGGKGAVGNVVAVSDTTATVQWPTRHKGEYKWGQNGKFELIKVGSADENDFGGREVQNEFHNHANLLMSASDKGECSECSTALYTWGDSGYFKCNVCRYKLCLKCFRSGSDAEHPYTDVCAMRSEMVLRAFVAGGYVRVRPSSLAKPLLDWEGMPQDGSVGMINSIDINTDKLPNGQNDLHHAITVTRVDDDDEELGGGVGVNPQTVGKAATALVEFEDACVMGTVALADLMIVHPNTERLVGTWMGVLLDTCEAYGQAPSMLMVADQSVTPEVIERKYKVGTLVDFFRPERSREDRLRKETAREKKMRERREARKRKEGRSVFGKVMRHVPNGRYIVTRLDHDDTFELDESDIVGEIPFGEGTRAMILVKENYDSWMPPQISGGMVGTITNLYSDKSVDIRFVEEGQVHELNIEAVDFKALAEGKWSWRAHKKDDTDGPVDSARAAALAAATAAAPMAAVPKSSQMLLERAFLEGNKTADILLRGNAYTVRMEDMTLRDRATGEIMGDIKRSPEDEPWKERKTKALDDGKWHMMSLMVEPTGITAFCDGEKMAVFATNLAQKADDDDCSDEEDDDTDYDEDDEDDEDSDCEIQACSDNEDEDDEPQVCDDSDNDDEVEDDDECADDEEGDDDDNVDAEDDDEECDEAEDDDNEGADDDGEDDEGDEDESGMGSQEPTGATEGMTRETTVESTSAKKPTKSKVPPKMSAKSLDDGGDGSASDKPPLSPPAAAAVAPLSPQESKAKESNLDYAKRLNLPGLLDRLVRALLEANQRPQTKPAIQAKLIDSLEAKIAENAARRASPTPTPLDDEATDEEAAEMMVRAASTGSEMLLTPKSRTPSKQQAEKKKKKPASDDDEEDETDMGSDEDDEESSGSGSSSSSSSSGEPKKSLPSLPRTFTRTPEQAMWFDVRRPLTLLPFTGNMSGNKFSDFPQRHLNFFEFAWGDDAALTRAEKLFQMAIEATKWGCDECQHKNTRLDDKCITCGAERFKVEEKSQKRSKLRAVERYSKEARDIGAKMRARLRMRYERQLQQMEALDNLI